MDIRIDKEILEETTECNKNFSCLTKSGGELCEIEITLFSDKVYFIKCKQDLICNYKMDFEKESCCFCPTRKEIYNKYKFQFEQILIYYLTYKGLDISTVMFQKAVPIYKLGIIQMIMNQKY